jgi:hypothetical protein
MKPAGAAVPGYDELRKLTAAKLAGNTLDAAALVHEVYLKLGGERSFATRRDYISVCQTNTNCLQP